jgi:two-component system, response regulator, stage 0 sporulation protein F
MSAAAGRPPATSLGRILVVDDERPVADVLSEYLQSQGYTTHTAGSGAEALAVVERERPDLVLLDIRMPGIDGLEVLRRLRQADRRPAVIMVTANEDLALARETLKTGAFDYVAKPFDFQYLDRVVAAAMVQAESGFDSDLASDKTEPCRALALAVFRAVRSMSPAGREATGQRLESAALALARERATGFLTELELLVEIASEMGDLTPSARSTIDRALGPVRAALGPS